MEAHDGYSSEAIAFLGLSRLSGIGHHTLYRLGGKSGLQNLLATKDINTFDAQLAKLGARGSALSSRFGSWDALRRAIWEQGHEAAEMLSEKEVRLIFEDEPTFPLAFKRMPQAIRPLWIFVQGDRDLLNRPSIAVVGTREPTPVGEFLAKYAVSCAQTLGVPVVSGLAKGIDRVVHEWCLEVDLPTISVLGTGILRTYPARHASLGEEIVRRGGALISEYLPEQAPSGEMFVWRNRLQAALARAVVPAEWDKRSGTAHTVRFATSLKRPVLGLSLSGGVLSAEAGQTAQKFKIPTEHAAFIEALTNAVRDDSTLARLQSDLFGEA